MVPPSFGNPAKRGAGKPPVRLAWLYVPNGVVLPRWRPQQAGPLSELPPILAPLAPVKDRVLVLSDLAAMHCRGVGGTHEPTGGGILNHMLISMGLPVKAEHIARLPPETKVIATASVGFEHIDIEATREYSVDDARAFLTVEGLDAEALSRDVDGTFISGFIRATKPAHVPCCGPACCSV